MKPIPLNALAKILGLHHPNQTLVLGAAIDSRKVMAGDLFFALPGSRVDGHAFLGQAAAQGACAAVVREDYQGDAYGLPLLRVPDVLLSLQDLARKSLQRRSSKVIAITGSLGKTTVKGFAATLLKTRYHIFSSPMSYNSQVTLPLSILMADGDEDYLILEMGMTHEGNLDQLISIAPPHIALLTTVAVQHAVNFSDGLAGISREKASIFSHPQTKLGIFHRDVVHFEAIKATGVCPKKTFSMMTHEADYFLEMIPTGVRISVRGEAPCDVELTLPIKVHYQNFLSAFALAHQLQVPLPLICEAAHHLKLPPMRFEKVEKQGILFINDAYNANPDAILAALENLPKPSVGGKVIAVLSEMDALGAYSEAGHVQVAQKAFEHAHYLLCLGPRCHAMCALWEKGGKPAKLFATRDELALSLKQLARPGDVILLKGARAYALDQLLEVFP